MSVQKLQSTDSGLDDFDDAELEQLYTWIDSIPLSRPKKNIGRDFSDGGRLHKLCLVILTFKNDDSFLLIFLGHCLQIKKKSKNKKIECQLNQLISCMYVYLRYFPALLTIFIFNFHSYFGTMGILLRV